MAVPSVDASKIALRHLRGAASLTGGQSQASIFNDLRAWLRCAMEGEMVNQPTAEDRLIDRRSVLRAGAALAAAGPSLLYGAHAKAPLSTAMQLRLRVSSAARRREPWSCGTPQTGSTRA